MSLNKYGSGQRKAPQAPAPDIAVIDCETDPFRPNRHVEPFAWGFFNGVTYRDWHGKDCTRQLLCFLQGVKQPMQIFAHNGGRFDFMFFLRALSGTPLVINGRIVDASLGIHTVSDSYARIPVPLARFGGKKQIDYSKMEAGVRHKYMPEILDYLKTDCTDLYRVIIAWTEKFGHKPSTMASASFNSARKIMGPSQRVQTMRQEEDAKFRKFFYGGRVQAFRLGVVKQEANIFDVNSMYPYIMASVLHPSGSGASWKLRSDISDRTDFALIEGWSAGALPLRDKQGRLGFPSGLGTFYASGHEIRAGIKMERLRIKRVLYSWDCSEHVSFKDFVLPVYQQRLAAKARGDVMETEFLKLQMNSCYGKYAINPRKFKNYLFLQADEIEGLETLLTDNGLEIRYEDQWYHVEAIPEETGGIWRFARKGDETKGYKNVATAASITAAARAYLFEMLCLSQRPIYCDTDSITCQRLNVSPDANILGAWKHEASGDEMAIAGKKMYALFGDVATGPEAASRISKWGDPACVKLASKGVRMHASHMRAAAMGHEITMLSEAPKFDVAGHQGFVHRKVRITNTDLVRPFPGVLTRADIMGGFERVS